MVYEVLRIIDYNTVTIDYDNVIIEHDTVIIDNRL